ncbi:MAG: cell division protein FtsL [Usitatibacter sp.]
MGRVAVILLVLVMLCAIGVVTSQHRARKYFNDLEVGQAAVKKLDEEFGQLQLEQSTWATHKRLEAVAAKELGMRLPDAASTVVVTVGAPPPKAEAAR